MLRSKMASSSSSKSKKSQKMEETMEGIYQKELTPYDENRLPHKQQRLAKLKRSELLNLLGTEFVCPICLDLLKKTMVTECLHRFCYECIGKSIRNGIKECPTCRKKLTTKRNLRADPNMDKLISTVWPDRALYETMQAEQAQKWDQRASVQALQQSIWEGIQAQAKARRQSTAILSVPAVVLGSSENKKLGPESSKNTIREIGGRGKQSENSDWRLEIEDEEEENDEQHNGDDDGDDSSTDLDSSDSSSTTTSSSSSSSSSDYEEEDDADGIERVSQTNSNNVVQVDPKALSVNPLYLLLLAMDIEVGGGRGDDALEPPAKKPTPSSSVYAPWMGVVGEESGVCLSSCSSSTSPPTMGSDDTGFFSCPKASPKSSMPSSADLACMGSLEGALRQYAQRTFPLGIITVQLKPVNGSGTTTTSAIRVQLHHSATIAQLLEKSGMASGTRFFIKSFDDRRMMSLCPADSLCTVLGMEKRANFFDYPTIFFNST